MPLIRERWCVLDLAIWRLSMNCWCSSRSVSPCPPFWDVDYPIIAVASSLWDLDGDCNIVGEGNGNPLQYSCLMDRGAWRATVRGVAKSWT